MSPRDLADMRLALKARKAAAAAVFERSECEGRCERYKALMAKGKAEAKACGDYQSPNRNPYYRIALTTLRTSLGATSCKSLGEHGRAAGKGRGRGRRVQEGL